LVKNPNVTLYLKLEGQNPGGSVKDRAAYNMIKSALERGDIDKTTKLIEPTSGNTGIALAMVASIFGLDIELVMPENATIERVQTMRAYGAKVTLTDGEKGIIYSRDYAEEKMKTGNYYMFNQFGNEDNWKAHYKTTGPEVWEDTHHKVTHFVSSMGTTGTIMGTSRFLKEKIKTYNSLVFILQKVQRFLEFVNGQMNTCQKSMIPNVSIIYMRSVKRSPKKWRGILQKKKVFSQG